jgi:hypothetical protein
VFYVLLISFLYDILISKVFTYGQSCSVLDGLFKYLPDHFDIKKIRIAIKIPNFAKFMILMDLIVIFLIDFKRIE